MDDTFPTLVIEDKVSDEFEEAMKKAGPFPPVARKEPKAPPPISPPAAEPKMTDSAKVEPEPRPEPSGETPEQGTKPAKKTHKAIVEAPKPAPGPSGEVKCCPKCNSTKPVATEFGYRMVGGKQRPQSYCRNCRGGKK